MITAASVQDREGARTLLATLGMRLRRLRVIWADGAYAGTLAPWVGGLRKWGKLRLEIVRKPKGQRGFAVVVRAKYSNMLKPWVIVLRAPNGLGRRYGQFWTRVTLCYIAGPGSSFDNPFSPQP